MRGMFSVYETAGGGYHIAYRQHGSAEETHIDIPGMVVRMARVVGASKISISREAMDGRLPGAPGPAHDHRDHAERRVRGPDHRGGPRPGG